MRRTGILLVALVLLAATAVSCSSSSSHPKKGAASQITNLSTCVTTAGKNEGGWAVVINACPHASDVIVYTTVQGAVAPSPTTTTKPVPITTTTKPPVVTTTLPLPPSTTTPPPTCSGTTMVNGQADIDASPPGTTFCLSGTHNWTLTPKTGDTIHGGVLDGGGVTARAFIATSSGVTLDGVEVRNYVPPAQQGAIAGTGSGWILRNLQVHDNGTVCATAPCTNAGGDGADLGTSWQILGGRYDNNRQSGLARYGNGTIIDGAEIDHNDFTNDNYTTQNIDCGFEAGGVKTTATGITIKNTYTHDNACRGLWADVFASNVVFTNNRVINNWADGLMIEISGSATVTNNTVIGNGFNEFGLGKPCQWGYGSGILISTSGQMPSTYPGSGAINVTGNTVSDNCQAITGIQQNRGVGFSLSHVHFNGNTLTASTRTGALNWFGMATDVSGVVLANQDNTIGINTIGSGIRACQFAC